MARLNPRTLCRPYFSLSMNRFANLRKRESHKSNGLFERIISSILRDIKKLRERVVDLIGIGFEIMGHPVDRTYDRYIKDRNARMLYVLSPHYFRFRTRSDLRNIIFYKSTNVSRS